MNKRNKILNRKLVRKAVKYFNYYKDKIQNDLLTQILYYWQAIFQDRTHIFFAPLNTSYENYVEEVKSFLPLNLHKRNQMILNGVLPHIRVQFLPLCLMMKHIKLDNSIYGLTLLHDCPYKLKYRYKKGHIKCPIGDVCSVIKKGMGRYTPSSDVLYAEMQYGLLKYAAILISLKIGNFKRSMYNIYGAYLNNLPRTELLSIAKLRTVLESYKRIANSLTK